MAVQPAEGEFGALEKQRTLQEGFLEEDLDESSHILRSKSTVEN